VRLTVRDASHAAEATLVIHAVNATVAAKVLTGDVTADCHSRCDGCGPGPVGCGTVPAAGAGGCASFASAHSGVDCVYWPVTGAGGKAFTLTSTGGDPTVEFFDKCDAAMGKSLGVSRNPGQEVGVVPPGTGCVVAWESAAIAPGGKSTLTFSYS
jgi:hypothetical protein